MLDRAITILSGFARPVRLRILCVVFDFDYNNCITSCDTIFSVNLSALLYFLTPKLVNQFLLSFSVF